MPRLPKGGVGHEEHDPRTVGQRPVDAAHDLLERVHVLDRKQEDSGVVRAGLHADDGA